MSTRVMWLGKVFRAKALDKGSRSNQDGNAVIEGKSAMAAEALYWVGLLWFLLKFQGAMADRAGQQGKSSGIEGAHSSSVTS